MPSKPPAIYVHIGYPKAASTTLQKHLFNKHSQITNLGLYPTGNLGRDSLEIDHHCLYLKNPGLRQFYHDLVMGDRHEYDANKSRTLFKESVEPYMDHNNLALFSNERFTSVFFSYSDIEVKANRLKHFFPKAKIIVVIRNQFDLIESQYRDHPFEPTSFITGKPVSINRWIDIAYEKDSVIKFLSSLKYSEVIDIYQKLFGSDNIGVFLFEDLVHRSDRFIDALSSFMKISPEQAKQIMADKHENIGLSNRYNAYRKLMRRFAMPNVFKKRCLPGSLLSQWTDFVKTGEKRKYRIHGRNRNNLTNFFTAANHRLNQQFDLDLNAYGYPM